MYKIGDRVKINKIGTKRYFTGPENPQNVEGIVYTVEDAWVKVIWDNGHQNSYQDGTLDVIIKDLTNT